ncbi:MAG: hypothetical protein QW647_06385 [Candidatus Bathyarchaeia archaeon]
MVKVKLNLPINSTFLSEVIYEGLLYLIKNSDVKYFTHREIEFKENFLKIAYKELKDYENIKIALTGNDYPNTKKLFEKLNLPNVTSKNLNDLFNKLHENANEFIIEKHEINLIQKIKKNNVLYGIDNKAEGISLQLLKVDRYTGFTSIETEYITQQLPSYFSKELILIALLGIYSSYVTSISLISEKGFRQTHYFLFFSPEEILILLSKGDFNLLESKLILKEKMKEIVKERIKSAHLNEILLLDINLNLELHKNMEKENLDKLSTLLVKLNPEGQTYKIYEETPITIFRELVFHKKIKEYFKNHEKFVEFISNFLNEKSVKAALSSFTSKSDMKETNDLLSGIINLYKFIVLGDTQSFSEFIRNIWNAYEKTKEEKRGIQYLNLLKSFSYQI